MIRVSRPATIPAILQTRGVAARQALCVAYDAAPAAYASGSATFKFNAKIYGAAEVKEALRLAQHGKCCFCESRVSHISFGDVEHFRPKAAYCQRLSGPLRRPGYYWLAYEWTNLFFCCEICNRRGKANLFPLANPRRRVRSRRGNLAAEEPLFVNPGEDPSPHIQFRNEYAESVRNSRRGQATIDALELNRDELVEQRRERLKFVRALVKAQRRLADAIQDTQASHQPPKDEDLIELAEYENLLSAVVMDSAEYAAMVRAALS